MAQITLYHAAPSRSSIVHWMLEELGEPYDIHLVSFKKGENQQARVPRRQSDGQGAGAEARRHRHHRGGRDLHLSRRRVPARPSSTCRSAIRARGAYLKWLFFGPSCVEPAIMDRAFPRKETPPRGALGYGDFDTVVDVVAKARGRRRSLSHGRAVHRRRRGHRLRLALGHDVQADARAAGVHGLLSRALAIAPPSSARSRRTPKLMKQQEGA